MISNGTLTLKAKLVRVFLTQIGLISVITFGGVYAAKFMVQDVLIRKALTGEAAHFWQRYQQNPKIETPNTLNLLGYLSVQGAMEQIPNSFHDLPLGMNRAKLNGSEPIVYVDQYQDARLFLVFNEKSVKRLSLVFGILPLTAVLIVLYILAWLAYRQSAKAVSPLSKLAKVVDEAQVTDGQWQQLDLERFHNESNSEVITLANALSHYAARLEAFVERERQFTRDASHELRTPLAVFRSTLDVLERKYGDQSHEAFGRMQRTLSNMESLINTLLLLARGEAEKLPTQPVCINDVIAHEIDALKLIHHDKPITFSFSADQDLVVDAPSQVIAILISNLLGNACNYTPAGAITVNIRNQTLLVNDGGIGMSQEQVNKIFTPFYRANDSRLKSSGHGLGMSIVKRLCDRYRWRLTITSAKGEGTKIQLKF